MAQPTVKTVQIIDPRIEPQPDPVYDYVIAPTQNQFYSIPASGKSNSSITFNNLTTLGIDRAYLDTFEIELTCDFVFHVNADLEEGEICPPPNEWTFDSWPFNKCCEEIHVNINGGAFFSQPLSYLRAKERYMDQAALARCYENVCPVQKPYLQYESGDTYTEPMLPMDRRQVFNELRLTSEDHDDVVDRVFAGYARPTRYGYGMKNWQQGPEGMYGSFNNSIVHLGPRRDPATDGFENLTRKTPNNVDYTPPNRYIRYRVTWREPIFCSPFSSRYDATYGRPLYNITSMDMTFTMMDLGNMIRIMNCNRTKCVDSYTVNVISANLCYQVMTIPPVLTKPLTTLVPYRRFVPYVTNITNYDANSYRNQNHTVNAKAGVYTFNEVPTAIWIWVGPSKHRLQTNEPDVFDTAAPGTPGNCLAVGNWDSNKLFGYIKRVDLTLANTTQILNTAKVPDLYRIAKANGCEDSYLSWSGGEDVVNPVVSDSDLRGPRMTTFNDLQPIYAGAGSVLRLKPGVDIIIPDQALIAGANANNMVFTCNVDVTIPKHSAAQDEWALWLLFEYVGVAAISPGQCEITMNPLGSGEIMASSPVISATSEATEGKLSGGGNGIWDRIIKALRIANQIAKDTGIVSRILKLIPGDRARQVATFLDKNGYGSAADNVGAEAGGRAVKRSRGGAVLGRGLQDWSV